jgi:hypothetical protein
MPLLSLEPSRAELALRQSPIPALRRLSVQVTDSTIVITGTVPSYYLKQLAQETLMSLRGARKLENRVLVERQPEEALV